MLKRASKLTCLFIVLVIFITSTIACSSNQPTGTTPTEAPKDNETPAEVPEKHVTVLFTKGGFEEHPENDVIKAEIEKESGVKFTHIAPPAANYTEQVNVILSSNDLPDIVKLPNFSLLFDYASQGALLPLNDLLKDAPDIAKNIPEKALEMCSIDGEVYGIPIWTSTHRYNFIVRGDWLDNLGLEEPKTLDDLYSVYKAFTFDDPDGNDKADTYGLGGSGLELFEPIFGAFGAMGVHRGDFYEDGGKLLPQATNPKTKEALAYISKLYSEGLVDPEWVTTKSEAQLIEKAMKNDFGSTHRWWTWEPKVENEMKKVDPNVEFRRIAPPIGPDGQSGVRGVGLVNTAIVILKSAKDPEAAMQFLNYYHTDKGMMTAYTGVEGIHWEQKDGKYVTLPQFEEDAKWIQWYSLFENEQPLLEVETYLVQSRRDSLKWPVITNAADGLITNAQIQYGADLQELVENVFTKIIRGEVDINEFDSFVEQYNLNGGSEWIEEVNDLYQKGK